MNKKFCLIAVIAIFIRYGWITSVGHALPMNIIDDLYTSTSPSTGTNLGAPNTFTSTAVVGGDITYTVNAGSVAVGFAPFIVFFGGAETVSEMFMTFDTIAGNLYKVDFDTLELGAPSTHAIDVSAFDGEGVGGALLGTSGTVGANSVGNFTFTGTSNRTTVAMIGVFGAPNSSSDIGFDNFQVSTVLSFPFRQFYVTSATISFKKSDKDAFNIRGKFEIADESNGIHPDTEEVKMNLGNFSATLDPGSLTKRGGSEIYRLETPTQGLKAFHLNLSNMTFHIIARNINLSGTSNVVNFKLQIGDDKGQQSIRMRGNLRYNERW